MCKTPSFAPEYNILPSPHLPYPVVPPNRNIRAVIQMCKTWRWRKSLSSPPEISRSVWSSGVNDLEADSAFPPPPAIIYNISCTMQLCTITLLHWTQHCNHTIKIHSQHIWFKWTEINCDDESSCLQSACIKHCSTVWWRKDIIYKYF